MQGVDEAALEAALKRWGEVMLDSVEIAADQGDLEEMVYKDYSFYGALGLLRSAGAVDLEEYKTLRAAWDAEWKKLRDVALKKAKEAK